MTRAEQYQSVRSIIIENMAGREKRDDLIDATKSAFQMLEAYERKELAVLDRVLEIINEKETAYKDVKAEFFNTNTEKKNFDLGWVSCAKEIRWSVLALKGGEHESIG